MKRRGLFSIAVAVLLVAVLLLFLVSFQVRRGECAIVFTFGRVARSLTQPGLYWKLPYPIQTVQRYDTRIRISESKFDEVTTVDGKNLLIIVTLGWSIQNPVVFYGKVRTPAAAASHLTNLARDAQNTVFAKHALADFVSTAPRKVALDDIGKEIQDTVRQAAEEQYGVQVHFARITHQGVPEQTTPKVFERMKAERAAVATQYRTEGTRQAEVLRAQANKEKADILSKAEAEATRERGKGDAAAIKYYAELQKNPELAIFLRKIDALRKLKEGTTLILDFRTPPYDLFQGLLPTLKALLPTLDRPAPKAPAAPSQPKPETKGP